MPEQIPLFEIAWDERDMQNAVESIGRGSYWAKGPFVDQFESELEDFFEVEHAVVVNSGTTGLVAGLRACGIGPGDEVIVPSFTFIATANAVRLIGATPVFADIDADTYGLNPSSVRNKITEQTAGIVPVHLYGGPCHIDEILDIADEEDLVVVEDAAEAFGATFDDKPVGSFGDAGVLSFCQNKVVVTGEGGAVVTDDDEVAANLRLYRSHGRVSGDYFDSVGSGEYVALGTNIRMSDLTAAIGCAQMEKADDLIEGRRSAARYMNKQLADVEGVKIPQPIAEGTHVYQLYTVQFDSRSDRETVIETLAEHDISSKVYWDTPVHRTQYYQQSSVHESTDLETTNTIAETVLSLPIYPDLSASQADRIVDAVRDGMAQARSDH
ncbi:DegT/DnrJ/EryC1/StrS aminotransferase family protein [Haloarcula sp. K1]|uniref:DegT/DnrJ/EryC1/StrS family aminotransferase n=1 Tax=Haloarcula sp. K1 TaxID=1622207 RepID=UPI0007BBE465|nr:DegT/DnrJ/EryC1/StrS family aminotransferase [Haloarcula sp. K1]KZX49237.1 aminotransferase DegT [Haloarcula sp. K1]